MTKFPPVKPQGQACGAESRARPAKGGTSRGAAKRIDCILSVLERTYPDAACSLNFSNPLELLVATILSAQCTDVLVNKVTDELFKKYKTAKDYASADLACLEQDVSRVNFYRNKAKSIQGPAELLWSDSRVRSRTAWRT